MNKKRQKLTHSDNAWKELFDFCFPQFMEYCFAEIYQAIDWERGYITLDKELQVLSKGSLLGNNFVDKLIQVYLKSGKEFRVLAHIEIQGNKDDIFDERMMTYNYRAFDRYQVPIFSCAILTDMNKKMAPWLLRNRYLWV